MTLWNWYCPYSHFKDENTEAQKGSILHVTHPVNHTVRIWIQVWWCWTGKWEKQWMGRRERDKRGEKPPVTSRFSPFSCEEYTRMSAKKQYRVGGGRSLPSHLQASAIPDRPDKGFSTPGAATERGKEKLYVTDHECWHLWESFSQRWRKRHKFLECSWGELLGTFKNLPGW